MCPLMEERELYKVQTSNDDDGYEKPDLNCIIGASLVDDLGADSAVFEWIVKFCWPWHCRRASNRHVGLSKNLRAIQMVSSQTKSKI